MQEIPLKEGQTLLVDAKPLEIMPTPMPSAAITVVGAGDMGYALGCIKRATSSQITSPEQLQLATETLNNLQRVGKLMEEAAVGAGRPYREEAQRLRDSVKEILKAVSDAKEVLGKEILRYRKAEQEAREAALREKARLEAEEARAREEARLKAEALAKEAAQRQAVAEQKLDSAKTEKQFDQAAAGFNRGLELGGQAVLYQAQAALPVPAPAVVVPTVTKVSGIRTRTTAVILSYDLSKMPVAYLQLNEKELKADLVKGKVKLGQIPDLVFTLQEEISGTGRATK